MEFRINQTTRAILLFVDIGLLSIFSRLAFGAWLPPVGTSGFWFYIALLSLLLGSRLVTPFYHSPADVIAYGVSALVSLFLVNDWKNWGADEQLFFSIAVGYCGFVAVASFTQIFIKDSGRDVLQQLSTNLRTTVDVLGTPRNIYSLVIWFAIYTFHRNSPVELLWIGTAWATTVAFSPVAGLIVLGKKLRYQWRPDHLPSIAGEVVAYQNPNIVLFRQLPGSTIPFGSPLVLNDRHASPRIAIAMDYIGRDEGMLRRAVEIDSARSSATVNVVAGMPDNVVAQIEMNDIDCSDRRSVAILNELKSLVGIVAPETSIERLYFEVIKEEQLEEGRLVDTFIGNRQVIYQIVNGLTKEEIVHQKNTHGYSRA